MPLPALFTPSAGTAGALGRCLAGLGLSRDFVRENTEPHGTLRNPLIPTRPASLRDEPPFQALRVFFCDEPLSHSSAATLLGDGLCADLLSHRLLIEEHRSVRFPFQLRHAGDLLLLADYLGQDADAVMGPGETTAILYRASHPVCRIDSALDLGCGAGTLALLLARNAEQVIGTDINPRAICFAQWNAAMNGVENAVFRTGDMYQPCGDQRFDLIVSQPPYYPHSGAGLTFLHSGVRGDELAREVVQGLPRHLTGNGQALLFTSWPDGATRPALEHFHALELYTNRRELAGTRQSINVFRHAPEQPGWNAGFEVPADLWGYLHPQRIEDLFGAESLLRGEPELLHDTRLEPCPILHVVEEAGEIFARFADNSLLGLRPITRETLATLQCFQGGASPRSTGTETGAVRDLLQRGLLRCA